MKGKKEVIIICIFISIFLINFISAELLTSDAGVQHDSSIIDRFENGSLDVKVLVDIKNGSVEDILANISEEINVTSESVTGFEGYITKKGFEELLKNPYVFDIVDLTNAPKISAQLDESVELINVDNEVWNLGYTGNGIDVCVIDTGINADLTDLSGVVVDEKCYCDNCCPGGGSSGDSAEDDNGHWDTCCWNNSLTRFNLQGCCL